MTRNSSGQTVLLIAILISVHLAWPGGTSRAGEVRTAAIGDPVATHTVNLDGGDYTWQGVTLQASPGQPDPVPFGLGFVVALDQALTLTDEGGESLLIDAGMAASTEDGQRTEIETTGSEPARYGAIELVPVGGTDDAGPDGFAVEDGEHELVLERFVPSRGQTVEIRELVQPILIMTQTGVLSLGPLDGNAPGSPPVRELHPGDSAVIVSDTRLSNLEGGAAFYIASLDSRSPASSSPLPSEPAAASASPASDDPPRAMTSASPDASADPVSIVLFDLPSPSASPSSDDAG